MEQLLAVGGQRVMHESGAQFAKRLQWRQEILIFLVTLLLVSWPLAVVSGALVAWAVACLRALRRP